MMLQFDQKFEASLFFFKQARLSDLLELRGVF